MTEDEYEQAIVLELGGPGVLSARQRELAWRMFAHISDTHLRYKNALVQAVKFVMGRYWPDYEQRVVGGQQLSLDQPFAHLFMLAKATQEEIARIELGPSAPAAHYGAAVDQMIALVPIPTPAGYLPDPNSPKYTGDPIWFARPEPVPDAEDEGS